MLRSMMAAYIGAVVLVMGYLVTTSIVGQKIEYRETFARLEPLGNGALGEATRYWTQSRDEQPAGRSQRHHAVQPPARDRARRWLFLGFTVWRFSMTERAPSKRKLRKLAKREARDAQLAAVAPVLDGGARRRARRAAVALGPVHDPAAGRSPPGADQPRADRPVRCSRSAIRPPACGSASRPTARRDHPTLAATIGTVRGGFSDLPADDRGLLRRRAGVARARPQAQRDHRFDAGAELGHDRPEDRRDLRRAAGRQPGRDGDRPVLPAGQGRDRVRHPAISRLVHHPGRDRRPADRRARGRRAGAQPQQICRLGHHVRLVRRDDLPVTTWAIPTRSTPTPRRPTSR